MSKHMYAVEVWAGSNWLTLGVYRSKRSALRRIGQGTPACGYGAQERRVRLVGEGEAMRHKANMATLSKKARKERKQIWG